MSPLLVQQQGSEDTKRNIVVFCIEVHQGAYTGICNSISNDGVWHGGSVGGTCSCSSMCTDLTMTSESWRRRGAGGTGRVAEMGSGEKEEGRAVGQKDYEGGSEEGEEGE